MAEETLMCAYSGLPSLESYMVETPVTLNAQLIKSPSDFTDLDVDRIIQMAWEDRTPFEAIEFQFGLKEKDVIEFMRKNSLPTSFRMWRKRMKSRKTKHASYREKSVTRFKCSRQRNTGNKIAKR